MRYFLDTEFIEDGKTIDLISIGIVTEDGREYYAINYDCDFSKANQWVKENVLAQIPEKPIPGFYSAPGNFKASEPYKQGWRNKGLIAQEIVEFVGLSKGEPEFWGEWCSYDWVVFAQLFGTMMDLPKGYPMRCRDIIQLAEDELGIPSNELPPSLEVDGNHNALLGAKTVAYRYEWLQRIKRRIRGGGSGYPGDTERGRKAKELHDAGESYAAIATTLGISEAEAYVDIHSINSINTSSGFHAAGYGGVNGAVRFVYSPEIRISHGQINNSGQLEEEDRRPTGRGGTGGPFRIIYGPIISND